jgi:geranylgeranyl pyrophosphate synthase
MLDLSSDPAATGKDAHRDLQEGKLTFPYLKLLELGDAGQRATLLSALRGDGAGRERIGALAEELRLQDLFGAQQRAWLEGIEQRLAVIPEWTDRAVFWALCRRFAFRDG